MIAIASFLQDKQWEINRSLMMEMLIFKYEKKGKYYLLGKTIVLQQSSILIIYHTAYKTLPNHKNWVTLGNLIQRI